MGAVTAMAMGTSTAVVAVFDIHIERNAATKSIAPKSIAGLRPKCATM